eukprot:6574735-Karenia_brevis.AAC.1
MAGGSEGFGYDVADYTAHDRKNGGKGQHGALRQFFNQNSDFINANQPDGQKWKLGQCTMTLREGQGLLLE